jgi:hypothetical protein
LFKLGIYRLDQFRPESQTTSWSKFRNRLSGNRIGFHLFRTEIPATIEEIALFEHTIPLVRLSSGVYRTTFRGRFSAFDEHLNDLLARQFDTSEPVEVEDWAASDCLASSEWAASLFARFPASTLTASDLTLFLVQVCLPGDESYIMETSGEPLQYIRPPFVIRLSPPEPKTLALNSFIGNRGRAKFESIRHSWRIPAAWLATEEGAAIEQPPYVFRKIPLIHPNAQALRLNCARFAIRRHSVFEPEDRQCNVIRTMNIFNLAYFPKARLLEGARAVWSSLRPGGIWIVGRTVQDNPPIHNASIFLREDSGFRLIEEFGSGSEIQSLVLADAI